MDNKTQREQQISDHLSELIENTLEDLSTSKCIEIDEDDVSPLNLGMIAAYYYINYISMELFSMSLTSKTKLRGLLEIVCAAAEFESVPIRHHEDSILQKIYERLPIKLANAKFNDPHLKASILLQCHFSRIQLPADLESDQKNILKRTIQLIQASVDVISSSGWLSPALAAMEFSQMIVQATWDRDSPLRQIPHISLEIIENLKSKGVESIFDLMEMEDIDRVSALSLDSKKMTDVAKFVNRYPNVEVIHKLEDLFVAQGDTTSITVTLERESDDSEDIGPVLAPFYPKKKEEGWWVVMGDPKEKILLAIKKTTLQSKSTVKLEFSPPENSPIGKIKLRLYAMCDSYAGVDQEYDIEIDVTEAVSGEDSD